MVAVIIKRRIVVPRQYHVAAGGHLRGRPSRALSAGLAAEPARRHGPREFAVAFACSAVASRPASQSGNTSMNRQAEDSTGYNLRLYIAGQAPRSIAAIYNLRKLCETYLSGRYHLDVIDLVAEPGRAQRDGIIAVPTLVRRRRGAVRRIIGDLSNSERVLTRLDIDVRPKARRR
jgi:circadian clock protein KaiB